MREGPTYTPQDMADQAMLQAFSRASLGGGGTMATTGATVEVGMREGAEGAGGLLVGAGLFSLGGALD
jgi:hypothetical protein